MKAIEAFFNAASIAAVVILIALGILFVLYGVEVKFYEIPMMADFVLPIYEMTSGKEHIMFKSETHILDISYNK